MTISFLILAILTVAGMAAAMGMRNAVHCVLALTVGFAGVAALYLQLGAQFVGFTQIMVYVGAVAILAFITVAGTAAAMGMRNAVHCVLALTVGFAGVASTQWTALR